MRVILLKDIPQFGRKNDVKDVPDGYARNFLIPSGLAKPATEGDLKNRDKFLAEQKAKEEQLGERLKELKRAIESAAIEFSVKADEKGNVFGSVTKEMILKSLREHSLVTKERVDVKMDHPLKILGEHFVELDLKKGIAAKLRIVLKAEV